MTRLIVFLVILFLHTTLASAQVRVSKLVIKPHESFDLGQSDILVADTLIMMDSSRLILNKLKKDNFIRVTSVAVFGNHTVIDGHGINGQPGRNGRQGVTPVGPCQNGSEGRVGGRGLDGTPGINLFLYLEHVTFKGKLTVDLAGGTGGKGGNGGHGGGGSPGTVHCTGGNGANGGNAGAGGNGANGGTLTLSSGKNPKLNDLLGKTIFVRNEGGSAGRSGKPGYHGSAGLGPSKRNGKDGEPGQESATGTPGTRGNINFELKTN